MKIILEDNSNVLVGEMVLTAHVDGFGISLTLLHKGTTYSLNPKPYELASWSSAVAAAVSTRIQNNQQVQV